MSINACAALVEAGDPDRFLAAMAAPPDLRGGLFVLYALNLEIAKAPFVTQEPMIAEMRLQFWRDVVADAAVGKPVRAHEVAAPLAELVQANALPVEILDEMVAARRFDIYPEDPGQSGLGLDLYLSRTGGHLMAMSGLACGMAPSRIQDATDVGTAMATALWMRAIPDLARHGRVQARDIDSDALVARATAAQSLLRRHRDTPFGPGHHALRAAWLTNWVLSRVIKDPRSAVDGALEPSEFTRRASLLLKSLRRRF
ncbi:MAG: squalene/phytoene synthase family protein [Pseudomonadota bacterium]